jgi:hypothetical protein
MPPYRVRPRSELHFLSKQDNSRKITANLAVIFPLTTEIPQTGFYLDRLMGGLFRECLPFLFTTPQNLRGII